MSTTISSVEKKFSEMGAKVIINDPRRSSSAYFFITLRNGQFIINTGNVEVRVIDFNKKGRHLLLYTSIPNIAKPGRPPSKQRYLCGYDERDWFVCAIPKNAKTIDEAKESLKPKELISIELGTVKTKDKQSRHRKAKGIGKIHRQGEFMFIPMPDWNPVKDMYISKNEPMRANGRPHVAREVIRTGGRTVYTFGVRVLEEEQFNELMKRNPKEASKWKMEKANPTVYAKGTIRHPDHKTLDLGNVWHKVLVNTEKDASFARNINFID